jgi:hypothetical protein
MRNPRRNRVDTVVFTLICLLLIAGGTYLGWQTWSIKNDYEECEALGSIPIMANYVEDGHYSLIECASPSTTVIVIPPYQPAVTSPRDG